jgi:hypothetical protein
MVYRSKKMKKKIIRKRIKKLLFYFFIPSFSLFITSILLVNSDFFSISSKEFIGYEKVDINFLESKINQELEKKYFSIYNKKNFLLYPREQIEKIILEDNKIKDVNISYKDSFNDLEIKITEKKPAFLFCKESDNCFYVEENGKIFTKFIEGEFGKKRDFFVFFGTKEKREIMSEKNFSKTLVLISDLEELGLKIKNVEKKKFNEIIININGGGKIITFLDQDFSKILESLEKILSKKTLKINKIKKRFSENLKYINMSYGENIFYCLSGDECENNY